ncbi:MAG: small conductance mechanosensitive channel [Bacteroidia bacterium]|jgi:small conductance mechanosensitive channel
MEENLKLSLIAIAIIICAAILGRTLRWLMNKSFVTASEKLKVDPTRYRFLMNAVSIVIWVMALAAIVLLIPRLKALAITMFAGAGIMVVILGLAAQQAFSNIISGIFIVIFKPFRVGDMITVGTSEMGVVEDITLRHTMIKSFENKRIIIPNSVISSETIINDSIEDTLVCKYVEIGISYDSDVAIASKILQEVALAHPLCFDHRTPVEKANGNHQIEVRLTSFGDFSVNLRAYVWCNDPMESYRMHSDINKDIHERFSAEGVEIPFPYRTVVYKNDLPQNARLKDD